MEDDIASEVHAKKKADAAKRKLLIKKMRIKMQAAMPNIKTLPRDLWDKFKIADGDGSGRLEVLAVPYPLLCYLFSSLPRCISA